jgi:cytochrome c biogenesis protein CcmG, thiol:disulfide interchange protein DsbE
MPRKKRPQKIAVNPAKVLLGVGFILLSMVILYFLLSRAVTSASGSGPDGGNYVVPVPVNYPAPDLELENITGKVESLGDFQGQVVLVNNWATWCPPCKAEMPTLASYYNAHVDEGFMVIAIEAGDPRDQVAQFAEDFELPFKIWLDPGSKALNAFKNGNLPSSYVLDRNGTIRYAWTGEINREMLEKFITPLLSE